MRIIPFETQLSQLIKEYNTSKTLMGVKVYKNKTKTPIGPAAGPHTQLSGNLVAAFAAGSTYYELKTVQVMEGEELGIVKPCIQTGWEVFNTEWSTELTIKDAADEYIKAFLLIHIINMECGIYENKLPEIHFIGSVGYNLEGIKSSKVDYFLNTLKHPEESDEWKKDISYLKENLHMFNNVSNEDIELIPKEITHTITLSTMHGCKAEEIESIAKYLLEEKGFDTYIKLNPTLLGKEYVVETLNKYGYKNIKLIEENFANDLKMKDALSMIGTLDNIAASKGRIFGVKVTNTLPVKNLDNILSGDVKYMSGPPLFLLSFEAAKQIIKATQGCIPVSYSGGADTKNIKDIFTAGIRPVTVSSLLLKAGGYENIGRIIEASQKETGDYNPENYKWQESKSFKASDNYYSLCGNCKNCENVCPNRANIREQLDGKYYVIHRDRLCNDCGNCGFLCIQGHLPYREKITLFENYEDFNSSSNPGVLVEDLKTMDITAVRPDMTQTEIELIKNILLKMRSSGRIL